MSGPQLIVNGHDSGMLGGQIAPATMKWLYIIFETYPNPKLLYIWVI